jgi:hypothetical protein
MIVDFGFLVGKRKNSSLQSLQNSTITNQQSSILPVEPWNEAIPYPGSVQKSAVPEHGLPSIGVVKSPGSGHASARHGREDAV